LVTPPPPRRRRARHHHGSAACQGRRRGNEGHWCRRRIPRPRRMCICGGRRVGAPTSGQSPARHGSMATADKLEGGSKPRRRQGGRGHRGVLVEIGSEGGRQHNSPLSVSQPSLLLRSYFY
jgi:hypothetical protein